MSDDMTTIDIADPDLYETKRVDGQGRIYVGREYATEDVEIVIKRRSSEDKSDDQPTEPVEAE